ncbi:hypothetical protein HPB50_002656 [Hyalomma asiaticum]|uniref:Uncharacterized protein n=1 Tax=Hyalomma asiaticum TaxID=266040 RepID=A0ACB7S002_HYAAI|nr:hypothetical protein HPB50_002656 [Hyalomma asiaticum]
MATILTGGSGVGAALPDVIRIGVVYDHAGSYEEEKLLWQMLDRANLNASDDGDRPAAPADNEGSHDAAPSTSRAPHLSLVIERLDPEDSFRSAKKVCRLLEKGVVAVLGPRKHQTASLVGSACARHHVPHIYLSQEFQADARYSTSSAYLSMAPSPDELDRALQDLVKAQRWKGFTIVYERPEALVRLRGLLHLAQPGGLPVPVSLRQLPDNTDPRIVLREIAKTGESNIVLDVATHRLGDLLKHDLHTVDLTDLQNSGTNLTGFILLNRELWEQDIGAVRQKYTETGVYPLFLAHRFFSKQVRTDTALTQDALNILVRAIQNLARVRALDAPSTVICHANYAEANWTQPRVLEEAIKKIRFSGFTGPVWLDATGHRRNMSLHVAQLKRAGLTSATHKVGTWSASSGLNITHAEKMFHDEILNVLKNKTLTITTILNEPYVMLKKSANKLQGNDRFEGFCVDLLREVAATLGFYYQLKLVRDGAYGMRDAKGRWNGIMRELVDMEADLAIGDLTITSQREQAVDFTMPFMTFGVSILYKKSQEKRSLVFFLSPLSLDVWLCAATACVVVSIVLCCVARAQSAEWTGNCAGSRCYGCCSGRNSFSSRRGDWYAGTECGRAALDIIKGQEGVGCSEVKQERTVCDTSRYSGLRAVKSDFSLPNSLWFTLSAIMRQRCDRPPRWRLTESGWSPYRNVFSSAILRLQERGTLQKLKDRWWKVRDPLKRCPKDTSESRTSASSELGLPKVGGVFVVLLAGLGVSCLIAFAELFFKARTTRT